LTIRKNITVTQIFCCCKDLSPRAKTLIHNVRKRNAECTKVTFPTLSLSRKRPRDFQEKSAGAKKLANWLARGKKIGDGNVDGRRKERPESELPPQTHNPPYPLKIDF